MTTLVSAPTTARVTALLTALLLLAATLLPPAVAAQSAPDTITITQLSNKPNLAENQQGTLLLETKLSYSVTSTPQAFILLFLFENDEESSDQKSSQPIWVPAGAGTVSLDVSYQPRDGVRTVSLVAALFKDEQTMLAWVSTNPISLQPWPGRNEFDQAMVSRLSGDYAASVQHLTNAIALAPDTGNYYYWRADALIRLSYFDDAVKDYTRALELMPNDRLSRIGRGVAYTWAGAWNNAVEDLTVALDNGGPLPDAWAAWAHRARGVAFVGLNRYQDAVADYQAYLQLSPNAADRVEVESWINALS